MPKTVGSVLADIINGKIFVNNHGDRILINHAKYELGGLGYSIFKQGDSQGYEARIFDLVLDLTIVDMNPEEVKTFLTSAQTLPSCIELDEDPNFHFHPYKKGGHFDPDSLKKY